MKSDTSQQFVYLIYYIRVNWVNNDFPHPQCPDSHRPTYGGKRPSTDIVDWKHRDRKLSYNMFSVSKHSLPYPSVGGQNCPAWLSAPLKGIWKVAENNNSHHGASQRSMKCLQWRRPPDEGKHQSSCSIDPGCFAMAWSNWIAGGKKHALTLHEM